MPMQLQSMVHLFETTEEIIYFYFESYWITFFGISDIHYIETSS